MLGVPRALADQRRHAAGPDRLPLVRAVCPGARVRSGVSILPVCLCSCSTAGNAGNAGGPCNQCVPFQRCHRLPASIGWRLLKFRLNDPRCGPNTFASGLGNTACSNCALNSVSAAGSTSSSACLCVRRSYLAAFDLPPLLFRWFREPVFASGFSFSFVDDWLTDV